MAGFLGVRYSLVANSGSSANLERISALISLLPETRRINLVMKPSLPVGPSTTVAPIVQVGAVPVFIDANPLTGNAKCEQLELLLALVRRRL